MHSFTISSDERPSARSVFACILAMTSSWFREPPFTPIRTGLPRSAATLQIVANCASRRRPVPTFPGLIRYLSSASAQAGNFVRKDVAVVVKVANEGDGAPKVEQSLLDLWHGRCRFRSVDRDANEPRTQLGLARGIAEPLPPGSAVSVLVIDCTAIGAPPPICT